MNKLSKKLISLMSWLVAKLPMSLQLGLGDFIGFLWFDVFRIRRLTVLDNLKKCFPSWTEEERIRIARASVANLGRSFIEFLRIPAINSSAEIKSRWAKKFNIKGLENLENALKKNKGVFLLSAHIGNGDWGTVGLALNQIQLHIISKEFKLKWLNKIWFDTRSSLGSQFISDRGSSLTILKLLKRNQIVVFMLDQFMGPPIGIKTTFFGHETGTPMGLALLAGRAQAAVVPTYTYREAGGTTCLVFEPEIPFVESENKDETIYKMTQKYCDKIEEWVRLFPEQWMWVHRRWKRYKY